MAPHRCYRITHGVPRVQPLLGGYKVLLAVRVFVPDRLQAAGCSASRSLAEAKSEQAEAQTPADVVPTTADRLPR